MFREYPLGLIVTQSNWSSNNNMLKRQYPNAEVMGVKVSSYSRVQKEIQDQLPAIFDIICQNVCKLSEESRKMSERFFTKLSDFY